VASVSEDVEAGVLIICNLIIITIIHACMLGLETGLIAQYEVKIIKYK